MNVYSLPAVAATLENWAQLADAEVTSAPFLDVIVHHSKARQFRAMAAGVRQALLAESIQAKPAGAPKAPRKAAAVKAPKYAGEQFAKDLGEAQRAIGAVYGLGWKCAAPFGETAVAVIPASLRSYKTDRGTVIKMPEDQRVPAGKYWPRGTLPDGLIVLADYVRESRSTDIQTPEWLAAHGYVEFRGDWVQPLEIHMILVREECAAGKAAWEAEQLAEFQESGDNLEYAEAAD